MFKIIAYLLILGCTQIDFSLGAKEPLPIVMWHGMGDTSFISLDSFKRFLEQSIGSNVYIKSLRIGKRASDDFRSGYFIHPNKQVKQVCEMIAADPKLKNGYNAIGFSQGAQFLRAVAQRCPEPRMNNLLSIGGQHQGVFGLPNCIAIASELCNWIRKLLNAAAYSKWVQKSLVQATYWHNPLKEEKYRRRSTFLAEINNELIINQTYVDNLKRLNKFVLVKFLNDTMVQPIDSQWFEFYVPGQDRAIQPLAESRAAKNLGLTDLVASKKMVFLETVGNHLQFTRDWFKEKLIPYLNGKI